MKKRNDTSKRFVICIDNSDYLASLEIHKIYTVLPDERAEVQRVIDLLFANKQISEENGAITYSF